MLILVKHGAPRLEPGTPPSQWTLAPEGRDQAERIAGKLADFSPSAVVSSLEPKAIETAAVIAGAFGLVAELDAGLGEQRNEYAKELAELKEAYRAERAKSAATA